MHFLSFHFISFHFISFYFLIAHVELMRTSWNKWLDCSWLKSKIEGSLMAEKTHKTLKIMLCVSFSYWILRNIIVHTSYIFMLALSHFYLKALYCCWKKILHTVKGGFHLHLFVFPFVYQFNSRIGVLVKSPFAKN